MNMKTDHIPYRQIHLDFHTSGEIPDIGACFDPDEFASVLKSAHVSSINLFTKCHHGMFYYPSALGTQHPGLHGFDLFGAQVKACRENDIRPVAYTCVGWNEDWAHRHPEWLMVTYEGILGNRRPFEKGYYQWNTLCFNQPGYRELLKKEMAETWERYHPDGFWIDIVQGHKCVCPVCMHEMLANGMDPEDEEQVIRHDRMVEISFCREFYTFLKGLDSNLDVFFNSFPYALDDASDPETSSVTKRQYFTFQDIESLPSDEWGYSHFPIAAAYIQKYDQEIAMMNGKFHFSWGDFGSIRNEKALEYECFRALAWGAKVVVGDQLHPCGRLEPAVYERIGKVFASIEEKEPWLHRTGAVAEIGVFITSNHSNHPDVPAHIEEGVCRVLQELHQPFQFLNSHDSLDGYRLLILPDGFVPGKELAGRIDAFAANGGRLLLNGSAGVDPEKNSYVLSCIKAEYKGGSPYSLRYLRLSEKCFPDLPKMDHILYEQGIRVAANGEQTAAWIVNPYFERSYLHFCSHRQTPSMPEASEEPGILFGENYAIISSPLFTDYLLNGYSVHREILRHCLRYLIPDPLIITDLPPICELTVRKNEQALLIHILSYVIQKKSKRLETIEEVYTALNRDLKIRTEKAPKSVRLVPEETDLPFTREGGYTVIHLDAVSGHTMLELIMN